METGFLFVNTGTVSLANPALPCCLHSH